MLVVAGPERKTLAGAAEPEHWVHQRSDCDYFRPTQQMVFPTSSQPRAASAMPRPDGLDGFCPRFQDAFQRFEFYNSNQFSSRPRPQLPVMIAAAMETLT